MSAVAKPGTQRQKRGDARREALVQAAAERFWTRGYAGSSIAQVAAAAGVPLGNVYYYHKTKADLAMAVADLFVGQTEALIDEVSAESDDPRGRLKALVGRLRASQAPRLAHGCPIAAACRDFRDEAPEAARRAAESFSILTGYIAAELGRTGMRPALALARARAIVCDWQGGIALGHALGEPPVLAEAFMRMERHITQT
ncbi:MAG: TetR/AcrR family transcriptional regulator [Roseitalea sp.]|nr:TetR/AcrR family transcriptional regulator [Roseitalea sp.]MBO6953520.1 TetR/AcrR family transcriptional regulator [Rhizobiaceae bacterium]MBO6593711.1 TetR/AcrR family transcriptional regulator [Roseitalea sp.]MBO6601264.1 TetR/AcrR family transcriptional regulator [Roseitalea sp.]MBO6613172.1 TetR/AcrR family transcriptional regulator [Roseitalea sp.]